MLIYQRKKRSMKLNALQMERNRCNYSGTTMSKDFHYLVHEILMTKEINCI